MAKTVTQKVYLQDVKRVRQMAESRSFARSLEIILERYEVFQEQYQEKDQASQQDTFSHSRSKEKNDS